MKIVEKKQFGASASELWVKLLMLILGWIGTKKGKGSLDGIADLLA